MPSPSITLAELAKLRPCRRKLAEMRAKLPKRRRITAEMAREAGVGFDDILWVASALARKDKDIERRLRLWMADCAARVLHIYEKTEISPAPRNAIIAARQYARGEIEAAARAAALRAAWDAVDAARDAAWAAWDAARAAARGAAAAMDAVDAARAAAAAVDAAAAARGAAAARDAAAAARDAVDAAGAERKWQFDRLVARMSENEPEDWPLPARKAEAA